MQLFLFARGKVHSCEICSLNDWLEFDQFIAQHGPEIRLTVSVNRIYSRNRGLLATDSFGHHGLCRFNGFRGRTLGMNPKTALPNYSAVLIPALQRIQHEFGYLQREALDQ